MAGVDGDDGSAAPDIDLLGRFSCITLSIHVES